MKRPYTDGVKDDVIFFVGNEVEKTPAFGMKTLFVTGIQSVTNIESKIIEAGVKHIFFGANHSFDPVNLEEWAAWESMILHFLNNNFLCTLDIPISCVAEFNEFSFNEHNNFIPQIRISLPFVRLWNYNTMIKIDDADFNFSNPGVWCHTLHSLTTRDTFTDWSQYNDDESMP